MVNVTLPGPPTGPFHWQTTSAGQELLALNDGNWAPLAPSVKDAPVSLYCPKLALAYCHLEMSLGKLY